MMEDDLAKRWTKYCSIEGILLDSKSETQGLDGRPRRCLEMMEDDVAKEMD
jgi:hypothetical protein